jgi:AraC-like DNA-binding protein
MAVVPALEYSPRPGYGFDVEVLPGTRLRTIAAGHPRWTERMNFHVMLYLTRAGYTHMIDFETYPSQPGTLLSVVPGQIHRFGDMRRIHGWMLMFRSDVLSPGVAAVELDPCVRIAPKERTGFEEVLKRIARDTESDATPERQALVAAEVQAFIRRIAATRPSSVERAAVDRGVVERFRRYRAAVERDYARVRTVGHYAHQIGCSPKSLTRACRDVAGMTPKEVLMARVTLEAKRLLAHTTMPIGDIADALGFSEATNFVKVFSREAGVTPGAFRRDHEPEDRDRATTSRWTRELRERVGSR